MAPKIDKILNLIKEGEGLHLELKACGDTLPSSIWETYSAFANTRGGIIILGVTENKNVPKEDRFKITGVKDPNKIVTDFFNILNNPQKVSRNVLVDSDVRIVSFEDKEVVYISVNEADYRQKPIYINNNLQSGTYKRMHEGDRHVTPQELNLLIRDSQEDIDLQLIEHFGLEDIDEPTLRSYRQNFKDTNPDHPYTSLSDKEFLIKLGGYGSDRRKGIEAITMAGLLMFGKSSSIHEIFTNFRVDYLNLIGISAQDDKKWNDRLTDDGRWEDNLYNFLFLTLQRLLLTLPNEGKLEGVTRKDGGLLYHAVREGFVNCLTYCDYKLGGVLRIDRKTDKIIMRNPGTLRISPERIYEGDYTQARNSTIQKMFRMIGLGDNIGSGFQKILSAWHSLGYLRPKIQEIPDVNEVWLTLPLYADQKTDKTDPKTGKADPKIDQTDPKIGKTDPKIGKTDPKTDKADPKTDKADPKIDQKTEPTDQKKEVIDRIISLILENPKIGYSKIAKSINIHESAAKRYLNFLRKTGKIKREGPAKGGKWIILD